MVPERMTADVIYLYHDHSEARHPGREETVRAIKQNYYCFE